jgi:hypothetical protein
MTYTCDECIDDVQKERARCKGPGKDGDHNCQNDGIERYDNDGIYISKCCDWCWHNKVGPGYNCYNNPDYRHDESFAGEALDPEPEVG